MKRLSITNSKKEKITFALEPWGELFEMQPKDSFDVEYLGSENLRCELDIEDDAVSLWVDGQFEYIRLYHGEKELTDYKT